MTDLSCMGRRCMLLVLLLQSAVSCHAASPPPHKYAAIGVLDEDSSCADASCAGMVRVIGRATKSPSNPLFKQDRSWELRIDNGCPTVVHDLNDTVAPYRVYYNSFVKCPDDEVDHQGRHIHCYGGTRESANLYAHSNDGVSWVKPDMNFRWFIPGNGSVPPGTPGAVPTNIYNGVNGVFKDHSDPDANWRFKSFGDGGIYGSSDGINFTSYYPVDDVKDMQWGTCTYMFRDENTGEYNGIARGTRTTSCGIFYPMCGNSCPFEDCFQSTRDISRLVSTNGDWRTTGKKAGNVVVYKDPDPNRQLYSQVTFNFLDVYMGITSVFNSASMDQKIYCELAWSPDMERWYPISRGTEFIPLGPSGSFDSHICFGAAPIMLADGSQRVYYMGGDGSHYDTRNSSFAMAIFRPDGLAGIGGAPGYATSVRGQTVPVNVTGARLMVTADTDISYTLEGRTTVGTLTISVPDVDGNKPILTCQPLTLANVTDTPLEGCSFASLVGKQAPLRVEVTGAALLYSFFFE